MQASAENPLSNNDNTIIKLKNTNNTKIDKAPKLSEHITQKVTINIKDVLSNKIM